MDNCIVKLSKDHTAALDGVTVELHKAGDTLVVSDKVADKWEDRGIAKRLAAEKADEGPEENKADEGPEEDKADEGPEETKDAGFVPPWGKKGD